MMRSSFILLAVLAGILFPSCSKNNFTPINGTINGLPALTLYGASNRPADYILIRIADRVISYDGETFPYYYTSIAPNIFISISPGDVQKATLDTSNPVTLIFAADTQSIFGSTIYVSK
jgi:hypothetical protein